MHTYYIHTHSWIYVYVYTWMHTYYTHHTHTHTHMHLAQTNDNASRDHMGFQQQRQHSDHTAKSLVLALKCSFLLLPLTVLPTTLVFAGWLDSTGRLAEENTAGQPLGDNPEIATLHLGRKREASWLRSLYNKRLDRMRACPSDPRSMLFLGMCSQTGNAFSR